MMQQVCCQQLTRYKRVMASHQHSDLLHELASQCPCSTGHHIPMVLHIPALPLQEPLAATKCMSQPCTCILKWSGSQQSDGMCKASPSPKGPQSSAARVTLHSFSSCDQIGDTAEAVCPQQNTACPASYLLAVLLTVRNSFDTNLALPLFEAEH